MPCDVNISVCGGQVQEQQRSRAVDVRFVSKQRMVAACKHITLSVHMVREFVRVRVVCVCTSDFACFNTNGSAFFTFCAVPRAIPATTAHCAPYVVSQRSNRGSAPVHARLVVRIRTPLRRAQPPQLRAGVILAIRALRACVPSVLQARTRRGMSPRPAVQRVPRAFTVLRKA